MIYLPMNFTHGWTHFLVNSRKILVMPLRFATQVSLD